MGTTADPRTGVSRLWSNRRRWRARWVVVALATMMLSGCASTWTQFGYDAQNQRYNPSEQVLTRENAATLTQRWSVPVRPVTSAPVVSNGRVHVRSFDSDPATGNRDLLGFDASTGERIWQATLPPESEIPRSFAPPAAFSGDELHLGTGASFTRYDPVTGTVVGRVGTGAPVRSAIVAGAGVHVLVTHEPSATSLVLQVRDAQTLVERWRAQIPASPVVANPSALVSVGGGGIFVYSRPALYRFPLDGCGASTCTPTWTSRSQAGDVSSPPVVSGATVYVSSTMHVFAYQASSGAVLWRAPLGDAPSFAAAANGVLYVTTGRALLAYDADGCAATECPPLWSASLDGAIGSPSVAGGVVYAGSPGAIRAFDAEGCGAPTCTELANVPITGFPHSISIAEGKLYALTTSPSTVTAFAPAP